MADKRITSRRKVYITRIGLTDWVVAVDSQKAALKAWDVHRNLFAEGAARVTNDPAHMALAMRTPGVPVAAPGRVVLPDGDLLPRKAKSLVVAAAKSPQPAKPDRSKLDAAERELRAFEQEAARARVDIERRLRAAENELAAFEAESERRRIRLLARIKREREAMS